MYTYMYAYKYTNFRVDAVLEMMVFPCQTCPSCGHVSKDNRQTQAKFLCVDCGHENHADLVGAINV